jgi:transposase
MDVLYPNCAGLDVHKDTVVACSLRVVDGKAIREVRTFKTTTSDLLALSEWFGSLGCTHIVMEATGVYWKPVWNILSDGDFELILANAAHVKNVPGRKTDVNDASWLADLLAHGLIRGSFVPDARTQEQRSLLRTRKQLTRERTSHVQRLQKTLSERLSLTINVRSGAGQHQARFRHLGHPRHEWAGDDRGHDCRREPSLQTCRSGQHPDQGIARKTDRGLARPHYEAAPLPAPAASGADRHARPGRRRDR